MRVFVTGRGNITLSTCATVCFILLYSKDTKRMKITGKKIKLIMLSVKVKICFLFSVQKNNPENANSSQNESCVTVPLCFLVLSVSSSHHRGRRMGYTCLWALLQGSDLSFQLFFMAETCQHSLCVEILVGRGLKGSFQILW